MSWEYPSSQWSLSPNLPESTSFSTICWLSPYPFFLLCEAQDWHNNALNTSIYPRHVFWAIIWEPSSIICLRWWPDSSLLLLGSFLASDLCYSSWDTVHYYSECTQMLQNLLMSAWLPDLLLSQFDIIVPVFVLLPFVVTLLILCLWFFIVL